MQERSIVWFRQDLRLADNPALFEAAKSGQILPVFILDEDAAGSWQHGAASRVWLHHSLTELNNSLGGNLSIHQGGSLDILKKLSKRFKINSLYWNRCYQPWAIRRDKEIKSSLQDAGIEVRSFNGSLLWEPWQVLKKDGTPYRVFTPFFRKGCLNATEPRTPLPPPPRLDTLSDNGNKDISALGLLPTSPRWDEDMMANWRTGESAAQNTLDHFLGDGLTGYKAGRNFPAKAHTSRLSPHLHWGEISPNTAWHAARAKGESDDIDHFCSELGWREFSYSLLYHFPSLPHENFQPKFDTFEWKQNDQALMAWQKGLTGIPIVDAGMRELWQTGYMHNRVRMIVASFLIKNLLIDWRVGEKWFWDTLVDADLANNSASWQWVAGSGADAAPYFRIFNPVTQAQKFDPDGVYIRNYVPEIAGLSDKHLYAPWLVPDAALAAAKVELGVNYPEPIADLKTSREEALAAFKALRA